MNIEVAYNILDIIKTMQDVVKEMKMRYAVEDIEMFNSLSMDLWDGLFAIHEFAQKEIPEDNKTRLIDACTCALESLKDIKMLAFTNPEKVEWKLDYELAAIIEVMAMQFFYWGIVDGHPEKRGEFREFITDTDTFGILKIPEEKREYLYDLTITVIGYNHLDYTKQCVESILNNWPKKIKCELILLNHGSSDDTKIYFENIKNAKVINVAVNGAVPSVNLKAQSRGRFNLQISNDVVVGRRAIENIYLCADVHADYGYIVPTTSAVSNLQTIQIEYSNFEQFEEATMKNNVYDEKRHEQRVRLCNPLHIAPVSVFSQMGLDMYEEMYCIQASFPDDRVSLWMRRNGYKCILAKDAYCHHYGSVTLSEELGENLELQKYYLEGRKLFLNQYGVDPWGTGFCYETQLFDLWDIPAIDCAYILGINCGLGSNSLKVKEILVENGSKNSNLYNCVQDKKYLQDLNGISDKTFQFEKLTDIINETGITKYNYIVIEEAVKGYVMENIVQEILNAGISFDQIAYKKNDGGWKIYKMDC